MTTNVTRLEEEKNKGPRPIIMEDVLIKAGLLVGKKTRDVLPSRMIGEHLLDRPDQHLSKKAYKFTQPPVNSNDEQDVIRMLEAAATVIMLQKKMGDGVEVTPDLLDIIRLSEEEEAKLFDYQSQRNRKLELAGDLEALLSKACEDVLKEHARGVNVR